MQASLKFLHSLGRVKELCRTNMLWPFFRAVDLKLLCHIFLQVVKSFQIKL